MTRANSPTTNLQIDGSNVVWQGLGGTDREIFLYDGNTTHQLTDNAFDDVNAQISGSRVVWQGYDGHDWEIYLYDGNTIHQVTDNSYDDVNPEISGSNIVWRAYDGHDSELFQGVIQVSIENLVYTPDANYYGTDSFTYKANDGADDSNAATVAITVNPVNDVPIVTDDVYSTNLLVAAAGILANDSDVDGDPLSAILVDGPSHGSLTLAADGSFIYTPDANYFGTDSFTYKANDGSADSNVATVAITVNAINDAPVAVDDSYRVDEDATLMVAAAGSSPQNLVLNGDFEIPIASSRYDVIHVGETWGDWTVGGIGSIDVVKFWQDASGDQSADLNGTPGMASVIQELPTTPGEAYTLRNRQGRLDTARL